MIIITIVNRKPQWFQFFYYSVIINSPSKLTNRNYSASAFSLPLKSWRVQLLAAYASPSSARSRAAIQGGATGDA